MECAKLNLAEPQTLTENMWQHLDLTLCSCVGGPAHIIRCHQLLLHDICGLLQKKNQTISTNVEDKCYFKLLAESIGCRVTGDTMCAS